MERTDRGMGRKWSVLPRVCVPGWGEREHPFLVAMEASQPAIAAAAIPALPFEPGRGLVRGETVRHEIPKVQARWLAKILELVSSRAASDYSGGVWR